MPKPTPRWTPVRNGKTYCSRACGGGCTYAEYVRATRAAARLAKRWGSGWKAIVWENLGWHYRVEHTPTGVAVHDQIRGAWATTTLGPVQIQATGRSPAQAVRALLAKMDAEHAALTTMRDALAPLR